MCDVKAQPSLATSVTGLAKPMGVGNRPRRLAPGLARWRLSSRRRPIHPATANAYHGSSVKLGAMALALVGSIADAAGLKGVGPATDLATHRRAVDRSSETALALLHSASPTPANGPALAMTPATASTRHGASVSLEAMATGDGLATDRPGDMLATHRASPTAFSAPALAIELLGVIHHHVPIAVFQFLARKLALAQIFNITCVPIFCLETRAYRIRPSPFSDLFCVRLTLARPGILADPLMALCGGFDLAAQFLEIGGVFGSLRRHSRLFGLIRQTTVFTRLGRNLRRM